MTAPNPRDVLDRLADPTLSRVEAEALMASLDGYEADAVLPAFWTLHNAAGEGELHAAVTLLARWSDRPVGRALPPALRALLTEPGVGDLNKLVAADLLATYGEPVSAAALAANLQDPSSLAERAVRLALVAVADPLALVNFLDALTREPQGLILALIEDLVALDDPRAVAVLAPLAQAADADVALSAVVALDELGPVDDHGTLVRVALHHPDDTVREQADIALRRAGEPPYEPPDAALTEAYLSSALGDSGQIVVLVRRAGRAAGALTILHAPAAGVVQYAAVEHLTDTEVGELLARLNRDGVTLAPASAEAARQALELASARTLGSGGALAVGYAAWPWVLGAG
jgi:HEAT repeat protein